MGKLTVGMIIEGSYPYIVGGVASWCHSLIQKLKSIDFKIIAILPEQYKDKEMQYKLSENVVDYKILWLGSFGDQYKNIIKIEERKKAEKNFIELLDIFFEHIAYNNYRLTEEILGYLIPVQDSIFTFKYLFSSKDSYNLLLKYYKKYFNNLPFMVFFWNIQSIFQPLYKLLTYSIPEADCYHALSTGYAGYVGVIAKTLNKSPLILTEHGIYVNERRDEIDESNKILPDFKIIWKYFFKHLCSLTYQFTDRVITLYGNNSISEIEENCYPGKIEIIPNGINLDLYSGIKHEKSSVKNIGIVARVVPIKDVITFIKACKYVSEKYSNSHFYIIGPTDEDSEYFEKCSSLVKELNLSDYITFTGKVNMKEYYGKLDIMVLTSVREAQPLTIMEAMASGIPCISSDVGSCSELLESVGFITPSKAPKETGEAILKILNNDKLFYTLSKKSKIKANLNYNWDKITEEYERIYGRYSKWQE